MITYTLTLRNGTLVASLNNCNRLLPEIIARNVAWRIKETVILQSSNGRYSEITPARYIGTL